MVTTQGIVEGYGGAWNETDEGARRRLLEKCWADGGTYTDPQSHAEGRDALSALIGGFQQQMPGARIEATSGADVHHNVLRFTWKLLGPQGNTVMEGVDFGELDGDGRIKRIVGFFGPPPAAS
ncbi:MAG: nuclear transport factor 2 family protein [Chloroflexi bacterium]|nr:nuclear transport factor 2 family protein [Chloroflexota bacterium]